MSEFEALVSVRVNGHMWINPEKYLVGTEPWNPARLFSSRVNPFYGGYLR